MSNAVSGIWHYSNGKLPLFVLAEMATKKNLASLFLPAELAVAEWGNQVCGNPPGCDEGVKI